MGVSPATQLRQRYRWRIATEVLVPDVDGAESADRGPRPGVRRFVGGFLGLFLVGGLLGVEAWPVTGWKMYAAVRHGERRGWEVRAVDADGSNVPVLLRRAPAAYHGVTFLLSDFERLSDEQRRTACLALGGVARSQYPGATGVVIDRVLSRVPTGPDGSAPAVERITLEQCDID